MNVGFFNSQFNIGESTCSEDSIHYSIEVYARSSFYSILLLIEKESYTFSTSSTLIDFIVYVTNLIEKSREYYLFFWYFIGSNSQCCCHPSLIFLQYLN